jgi:hypothetical protein
MCTGMALLWSCYKTFCCPVPVKPYITYGWFLKGIKHVVKYTYKKNEKYRVSAALSKDDFFYQFTEDNFNSDVFKKFLLKLLEKFSNIVIVVDQARYHTSHEIKSLLPRTPGTSPRHIFPQLQPLN